MNRKKVSRTLCRIEYAIKQFEKNEIEFQLKNEQTGHFHCWRKSDDKLFQFYAGTGKIQGYDSICGVHNLVKLLLDETDINEINDPSLIVLHTKLTKTELDICKALGAKWVSKEEAWPYTVQLWEYEPRCEIYDGSKSYEGKLGFPVSIASISPDKFPSLKNGDLLCVEVIENA